MPRAKKYVTKLQALTGDDLEEQLGRTIVIHPGSRYIRMGRPLEREAVILPHCIARKQRMTATVALSASDAPAPLTASALSSDALRNLEDYSSTKEFRHYLALAETWLRENSDEEKTARTYCSFDAKESEESAPVTKEFAVGNEALDVVALHKEYSLIWPLRYGRFNLHEGPGGSRSAVMSDLEDMWDRILTDELEVPRTKRNDYRAILIIPDIYDRDDVRSMVEILIVHLEFFAIFLVLENVASTFGSCLSSACVVDVGAEKTSISCVDDGISLPETRVVQMYGGDDVTRLCNWFLHQKLRAFTLRLDSSTEWFKMDAIKKALCHYDLAKTGGNDVQVNLPSPDREESVHIKLAHDFCRLPGLVLFSEGLVAPSTKKDLVHLHVPYEGASDDLYGAWVRNAGRKYPKKPPAAVVIKPEVKIEGELDLSVNASTDQEVVVKSEQIEPPSSEKLQSPAIFSNSKFVELHRAIFWSISRCSTEEQQKKMLKNILVVGGGFALFPTALEFLRNKLEELVPATFEMCIVSNEREVPADLYAFKGASIMAALETVQYLWITKEEWIRNGVQILREKSSFAW